MIKYKTNFSLVGLWAFNMFFFFSSTLIAVEKEKTGSEAVKDDLKLKQLNFAIGSNKLNNIQKSYVYKERALFFYHRNQFDESLADCDNAISLNKNNKGFYLFRAKVYRCKKLYDKALIDADKAISLDLKYPNAYKCKADIVVLSSADRMSRLKAVDLYTKALELNPKYPEAFLGRGQVKFLLREYVEAIKDFDASIKIDKKGYFFRGMSYFALGHFDKSLQDFRKELDQNPKDQTCSIMIARSLLYQNEYDKAKEIYVNAIGRSKYDSDAKIGFVRILYNGSCFEKVIKYCSEILGQQPDNLFAYYYRGLASFVTGDYKQAKLDLGRFYKNGIGGVRVVLFYSIAKMRSDTCNFVPIKYDKKIVNASDYIVSHDMFRGHDVMTKALDVFKKNASPEDLLRYAKDQKAFKDKNLCLAYYYIAQYYYLKGEKDKAKAYFKKCVDFKIEFLDLTHSARNELKLLGLKKEASANQK